MNNIKIQFHSFNKTKSFNFIKLSGERKNISIYFYLIQKNIFTTCTEGKTIKFKNQINKKVLLQYIVVLYQDDLYWIKNFKSPLLKN